MKKLALNCYRHHLYYLGAAESDILDVPGHPGYPLQIDPPLVQENMEFCHKLPVSPGYETEQFLDAARHWFTYPCGWSIR